ncbi:replication initiator protein [Nocardia sp. 852002-20019_SCH5090214]|uniref:replication initiator n=1 Tax=Nocardia sp. 852002-20019_SCH5090214 TaxID=1834087 RepID=UPI0007E9D647|nr:replication initiator [Nocardia sp. 852002-20019_SCH5090214]OBA48816.1 replication initiator protein [Nocardia sp. 852002-20019_SCH5090214]
MTDQQPDTDPASLGPVRGTAADRRSIPNLHEIAQAAADKHGECRRPIPMYTYDPDTGDTKYVGAPCKSTLESVCPSCAAKARSLRMQQAHEGWHIETEPVDIKRDPTQHQLELVETRASLMTNYQEAKASGDQDMMDGIREVVADVDADLRETGVRGRLPALDPEPKSERKRSTRRRQDVPDLPRKKIDKATIGRQYAGKYRPSMFITLTLDSYGKINRDGATNADGKPCSDGSAADPDSYDYRRAARDIVFFPALFDRFVQNYRRATGRDIQYFATVEPQKRGAPHIHMAVRGTDPRALILQIAAATYHQVWWPHFDPDNEQYTDGHMPVWDYTAGRFVDPDNGEPLPSWDEAMDMLDTVDDLEPAHVVTFGEQIDPKDIRGVLGGSEEASRHVGYLTKYLTKSIAEVIEPQSARAADHYDRLHAELCKTPCSPNCGVWLRYGINPKGATDKTQPGRCKGKAHRRDTLGLRGRRVLVSRRWTGKTLPDHKADRAEFVRQLLAQVGIQKPDTSRLIVKPVEPGDKNVPPREHLVMASIAQRIKWRAQYENARLAAGPPGTQQGSAIDNAA